MKGDKYDLRNKLVRRGVPREIAKNWVEAITYKSRPIELQIDEPVAARRISIYRITEDGKVTVKRVLRVKK